MSYVDYTYYKDTYLNGDEPDIDEKRFPYYERLAEALIRDLTLEKSDSYTLGDEVKLATCAAVEELYKALESSSDDAVPVGIASEKVGEWSASYLNNTLEQRTQSAYKTARMAAAVYLRTTGLLFRGVSGN